MTRRKNTQKSEERKIERESEASTKTREIKRKKKQTKRVDDGKSQTETS